MRRAFVLAVFIALAGAIFALGIRIGAQYERQLWIDELKAFTLPIGP